MQDAKVIDADGHVRDRDVEIRAFMDEPYCNRQGTLVGRDKWDSSLYGKLGMRDTDLAKRLSDMDQEGIDTSVLFPTSAFGIAQSSGEGLRRRVLPGLQRLDCKHLQREPEAQGDWPGAVSGCPVSRRRSQSRRHQIRPRRHHHRIVRSQGPSWDADFLAHLRRARKTQQTAPGA